jgi:Cu(I)/Ag(I) efflux system membrane protein CusA/SilA
VPLGQVATIRQTSGPMVVRTEDAQPTAWVYVDVGERDVGGYVAEAKRMVAQVMTLPPGYTLAWSGQYEYMERAKAKMQLVVPATLALVFLLLYLNFSNVSEALIVMLSIPFTLVGGVWFLWALDYNWSVAVTIGFLALAGVAAETAVIMLVYLDHAWEARKATAPSLDVRDVYAAVMEGAVERVRPKMMTVASTMIGLLPDPLGNGRGCQRDEAHCGADGGRNGVEHRAHVAGGASDLVAAQAARACARKARVVEPEGSRRGSVDSEIVTGAGTASPSQGQTSVRNSPSPCTSPCHQS